MIVAITGATGYLGACLCSGLAQAGHGVIALTRRAEAATAQLPGIEVQPMPRSGEPLPAADAVIHLAGESVSGLWTKPKMQRIHDSRIDGTRRLVDSIAVMKTRPKILVSMSAVGYYGDRGEEELDESAVPGKGFLADVCVEWEKQAIRAEELGLRVVLPRCGIVLGKGGGALAPMLTMYRLGLGGPLGSGRQWWPWVHLDDALAFLRFAVEGDLSGPYNVVAPGIVRDSEFNRVLGRGLRRPAILPAPAFALKLVLRGFSAELLNSRRVVPARTLAAGFAFRYPDIGPAIESLIHQPATGGRPS